MAKAPPYNPSFMEIPFRPQGSPDDHTSDISTVSVTQNQQFGTIALSKANPGPFFLCGIRLNSPSGLAHPLVVYIARDVTITTNRLADNTDDVLHFTVIWGDANVQFTNTLRLGGGIISRVGTYMQVFVSLVNEAGNAITSTSKALVNGLCMMGENVPAYGVNLSQMNVAATNTGTSEVQVGNSIVISNTPTQLFRIWGYNYGTTTDFLQLFDAFNGGINTATPYVTLGNVAPNGSFSLDVSEMGGIPFDKGISFAASSTGGGLTLDASGSYAVNAMFLSPQVPILKTSGT